MRSTTACFDSTNSSNHHLLSNSSRRNSSIRVTIDYRHPKRASVLPSRCSPTVVQCKARTNSSSVLCLPVLHLSISRSLVVHVKKKKPQSHYRSDKKISSPLSRRIVFVSPRTELETERILGQLRESQTVTP